jgi:hypothetical protein
VFVLHLHTVLFTREGGSHRNIGCDIADRSLKYVAQFLNMCKHRRRLDLQMHAHGMGSEKKKTRALTLDLARRLPESRTGTSDFHGRALWMRSAMRHLGYSMTRVRRVTLEGSATRWGLVWGLGLRPTAIKAHKSTGPIIVPTMGLNASNPCALAS